MKWKWRRCLIVKWSSQETLVPRRCYFPWSSVASLDARVINCSIQSTFHGSAQSLGQTPDFFNLGATCFVSVGNQNKVLASDGGTWWFGQFVSFCEFANYISHFLATILTWPEAQEFCTNMWQGFKYPDKWVAISKFASRTFDQMAIFGHRLRWNGRSGVEHLDCQRFPKMDLQSSIW